MSEFYYNLSMQALSNSDDTVLLKFEAINKLAINISKIFQQKYQNLEKNV